MFSSLGTRQISSARPDGSWTLSLAWPMLSQIIPCHFNNKKQEENCENTWMSDNLPTKRNLMASASSSCEMGSAHAITMSTCVSIGHIVGGGSSREQRCQGKWKANMHESWRTNFFLCLGNNISVASQTILLMLLNSIGWAKAGHWQHWDIEQASHPISVRENSDWSSKGGAGRGYPLLTLSNTLAIGWRSCL